VTGRKSSIGNQTSSGTKQTSTTHKPHNPRKRNSSYQSKTTTDDIVLTTLDHTPSTLSVNAIKSNFPDHISDEHLRQYFSQFKNYILYAEILKSKKGGKYGLITFSSYDIAEAARTTFHHNQHLLGCLTHLSHYRPSCTTPRNQMLSEGASLVPSMTDSHTTASICVEQSSRKSLHQASELEPVVTSGDSLSGNNILRVEGIHSKLPDKISDEDLMKHFCAFDNDIISASMVRNPQTKLSAGYGIIIFKSPVVAKKAQRKYNGTHLCRKYQLRVTLKNLASSTKSTILKGDEDTDSEVFSSSNDRRFSESNLVAMTKKQVPQTANGSSSSFAVSGSTDVKSLRDKETPTSFADGLVVENLSCMVEESELKDLVSSCGAKVSSCIILRNPVAVLVDTCVANISLVDSSQLGNVIKQLNGKEVCRCKLRVYATCKKPILHVEERKISSALFEFIVKKSQSQIKTFEEKGVVFKYQKPECCALISAPGDNLAIEFLLQVFNRYTEKSLVFKHRQWNQLTQEKDKYTPSLLNRAGSKFRAEADAHIIPQIDKHEILFVGTHEGVTRTSSWLMDQLTREIEIER
jgi:RNA recognition motif-containing protein